MYLPNTDNDLETFILKYKALQVHAIFMLRSSKVGNYYTTHLRSVQYYYASFTSREVKNQELVSGWVHNLPKNTVSQWQNSEYSQNAQSVPGYHQTTQPFFLGKKNLNDISVIQFILTSSSYQS